MPSMLFNQLITKFRAFRADEDGAVTVDFVVLTSFVVMMGLGHVKDIADASVEIGDDVSNCLETDMAAVLDGDPENFVANLQAAGAACSSR